MLPKNRTQLAFMMCSAFNYILMRVKKLKVKKENLPCLVGLNISTALAFISFYVSISLIPASIAAFL
ncbi:hypothetical protein NG42_04070 [Winslowiella iniecta]|uniref:Uncharacterized protein n=1 Tax=Winslowiella iniecta TaxID=1560201 RepID=A0A0L7T9R3_9GAMM|nr:hypothetical protein NG42_04070 [Winslowiella iniecta]KOC94942.1 hypothetical protein NG43_01640 [Winslowiella iniecta]